MSTDFFEQQDVARRRTGRLILLFAAAVVSIILTVYLVVVVAFNAAGPARHVAGQYGIGIERLWNPSLLLAIGAGTLGLIVAAALYKTAQLSSGGEAVALLLGGRAVNPQTQDLAERRLLNVVEEMALAAGVPVPPVFVLDREPSINAFAAGHQPGDAVIAVSRGCLEYLTRDELQGVMGHEFSHIVNGDMRLDLRLTGTIFGIMALTVLGYYVMRIAGEVSGGSDDKKGVGAGLAIFLIGVALMIIGYLGVFFGKLIKAAVSRQREYLADSAAVQFTRYPGGIAGALKKIGGLPARSRIADAHAEEVSHMFFSDAFEGMVMNYFATHPPLAERIARLDPTFDGQFPKVAPLAEEAAGAHRPGPTVQPGEEDVDRFVKSFGSQARDRKGAEKVLPLHAAGVVGAMGKPGAAQMLYASALVAAMPPPLLTAAREPYSARALVYALLMSPEEEVRSRQLACLQQQTDEPLYRELLQLVPEVDSLGEQARVPLADMTLPALKRLSPSQYAAFRDSVEALIAADGKLDLFEYMIRSMLLRHLDVQFGRSKPASPSYRSMAPLAGPLATVLSTLAYAGQDTDDAAQAAFSQGAAEIAGQATILPQDQCSLGSLDAALKVLAQAAPGLKRTILNACVACIAADGKVTVKESELLRAVSGMLDCPVPPMPAGQVADEQPAT